MGRYLRPALALSLALFTRPGPGPRPASAAVATTPGPASAPTPPSHRDDDAWYEPRPDDFRPPYDRDIANGGKQTWDQYWGWVRSFYKGNILAKGWDERARWLVEAVRPEAERRRLRTRLNAIGREICAEWSKDYQVRKVSSADLIAWGKSLEKARGDDDGTGAALHRAIDAIREQHRRKTEVRPDR